MKLFAQHGFQDGQKIGTGLKSGTLDGVIFSPRDIALAKLEERLPALAQDFPDADLLFDPQYYACFLASNPDSRLGSLLEDYGDHYFIPRRRTQLESEASVIDELKRALRFQQSRPFSAIIAPNIVVPSSCNSVEGVIAKHFIRNARRAATEVGCSKPLYVTLALSREALIHRQELIEFLEDITAIDDPPDGFYVLVAVNQSDARAEIYHTDVVAAWLLLNYTLAINGFKVINGYSDIMTPFLGVAGGHAGATGWWSNLRSFSLNRFAPDLTKGRQPLTRYLSCALLNRITTFELDALQTVVPAILNRLPSDAMFEAGSEPGRHEEAIQTWDALRKLNEQLRVADISTGLVQARNLILQSQEVYSAVASRSPIPLEGKSDQRHLAGLMEGLDLFADLAELR